MDDEPIGGHGTGVGLAVASAAAGAANWALFLLVEHGVTFGFEARDPVGLPLVMFYAGLALLCGGTMLAAMAMVPRGWWPLGGIALLVNLSLPYRMMLQWDLWQTLFWTHVVVGVSALGVLIGYRRRWAAGRRDVRTKRIVGLSVVIFVVALVVAICILAQRVRS